jgi:hypothetical protein
MRRHLRQPRFLAAALAGAALASLGGTSVAHSQSTAPVELATSNFNTPAGKLSALRARVTYQAGSFPIALRVTPPDSTWAGSQWTTSSHGKRLFGLVELGHPGATATTLPSGGIAIVTAFGPTPSVRATIGRLRAGGSGVTYTAPKAVHVSGYPGIQFDGNVFGKFGHTFVPFSGVTGGASPPDHWRLDRGESFRAIALSVHGKTVLLLLESFRLPQAGFTPFVGSASRLLAGLRFPR